jgi:hypothetical protein
MPDTQLKRAEAWRAYAIHLEVCGCGRGDRRCTRGNELRDVCIVADGLATDGVHNTPHPSSCACRRCNAKRDLAKQTTRPVTTPEKISELGPNDVFTFGSNTAGIHGKGAAKLALERFGAMWGKGHGHYGQSYAIPTREMDGNRALLRTLPLDVIAGHVRDFLLYADSSPEITFYVTKIGCGYAGYSEDEIAPMFLQAHVPSNVILPAEFTRLRA